MRLDARIAAAPQHHVGLQVVFQKNSNVCGCKCSGNGLSDDSLKTFKVDCVNRELWFSDTSDVINKFYVLSTLQSLGPDSTWQLYHKTRRPHFRYTTGHRTTPNISGTRSKQNNSKELLPLESSIQLLVCVLQHRHWNHMERPSPGVCNETSVGLAQGAVRLGTSRSCSTGANTQETFKRKLAVVLANGTQAPNQTRTIRMFSVVLVCQ